MRTTHWDIITSLLLEALKQRLVDFTSFRLLKSLYSRYVLFKRANKFGFVFPDRLDRIVYSTKSRHTSAFFFPFSISRITSTLKTCVLLVTVAIL